MAFTQLNLFIVYTLSGIIICIVFDFFRALRKSIKTSNLITYIEDTLFWILTGIFIFIIINKYSHGELRFYILAGMMLGAIIYYLTISKYIVKITVAILTFCKKHTINLIKFTLRIKDKIVNFFVSNMKKMSKFQKK